MLLPDVTQILDDPAVGGSQSFTVQRTTRKHNLVAGDSTSVTSYEWTGNVQPQGAKSLQMNTPEDARSSTIVVRSTFTFQIGEQITAGQIDPDIVIYNSKRYKVTSVEDWSQWGFTIATATEIKGE